MSLARIKELQTLIKTFWESGEISAQTRMEVGKAIEGIQKERSAARTMADTRIEDPLRLLESSYEKSSVLGERWIPPWEMTNIKPTKELKGYKPQYPKEEVLSAVEMGVIKKQKVGLLSDLPEKDIPDLMAELQETQEIKKTYTALSGTPGVSKEYTATRLAELNAKEERLTGQIYGKALWEVKQSDYLSEYRRQIHPGEASAQYFFTGEPIKGAPGSALAQMSLNKIQVLLRKKGIFTESQTELRKSTEAELSFIENVLVNPERAAEYERKAATPYFYEYWTERGGLPGLKEHRRGLKEAMQQEGIDEITPLYAKWGQLKTIEEAKSGTGPPFASLQGEVVELWTPSSPKIKQVGLVEDISGEQIKFTTWMNQPDVPTLEKGGRYYFGNVFLKEFRGTWGFEIKKTSKVEKVEGPLFYEGKATSYGASIEIRDYTKPYSIDPKKGTITYTTKGGKIVEMPVPKADMSKLGGARLGEEPGDLAAFMPLPLLGIPLSLQGNITGSAEQTNFQQAERRDAGEQVIGMLGGTYNISGELGGKWLQKGQEGYISAAERVARYNVNPEENAEEPYLAALDILGGALYPLNYPMQAAWGIAGGTGPMEGIRQEMTPAEVLGIEDPWQALGANLIGDPLNLLVVGALAKGAKAGKLMETLGVSKQGLKAFAVDESAELLPNGLARLYRVEPTPGIGAKGTLESKEVSGRWFSQNKKTAEFYFEKHEYENPRLVYTDVPVDIFTQNLVANLPEGHQARSFSRFWDREVFLPQEWALKKQPYPMSEDDIIDAMVREVTTKRNARWEITTPDDIQRIRESIVTSQKEAETTLSETGTARAETERAGKEWTEKELMDEYDAKQKGAETGGFGWGEAAAGVGIGAIVGGIFSNWGKMPALPAGNQSVFNQDQSKSFSRVEGFTRSQIQAGWERDERASAMSGIRYPDEQLQGGHALAITEGGKAEMSNYMTQTVEENIEQASSQRYRVNLPERLYKEGMKSAEIEARYQAKVDQINAMQYDNKGKKVNAAMREKMLYEAKRSKNLELYTAELNKIDVAINRAELDLRGEQAKLKQIKKEGRKDPVSERQAVILEHFIEKYHATRSRLEMEREREKSKRFILPNQLVGSSDEPSIRAMGREGALNRPGEGPELMKDEDIKGTVDTEQLTAEYGLMKMDVEIIPTSWLAGEGARKEFKQSDEELFVSQRGKVEKDIAEITNKYKSLGGKVPSGQTENALSDDMQAPQQDERNSGAAPMIYDPAFQSAVISIALPLLQDLLPEIVSETIGGGITDG